MAKTPHEMAAVGREYSHQTALFAWAAMARQFGVMVAADPKSYQVAGYARDVSNMPEVLPQFRHWWQPIPELKWLHAIKNAEKGGGMRGSMSVAEGVRAGVADVFLPKSRVHSKRVFDGGREVWIDDAEHGVFTRFEYHGLYLELKRPGSSHTSDKQLEFQADMRAAGYACEIVIGWEAARDCLLTYLGKSPA
jgi:hypothetical protein